MKKMKNLPNIAQLYESATDSALLAIKFDYRKGLAKEFLPALHHRDYLPPSHHPLKKLLIQPSKLNILLKLVLFTKILLRVIYRVRLKWIYINAKSGQFLCLSCVLFAKSDRKTVSRESNNVNRKLSFMKNKQKMFSVRICT